MKKKVLITGIDGFTGIHLSKYLDSEYEVFGTSLKKENKNVFKCDITKKDEVKKVLDLLKPDYIVHLAAISFVGHSNIEDFYRVNVIGTQNLLDSINYDVKKIIISSSAVVYGKQDKEVLSEDLCPNPLNHYGISKLGTEQVAKSFFDKFNIIITRPFNYTGLYQDISFLVPKIVSHFKQRKKSIRLGNLDVIREINSIDFVCEVYKRFLKNEAKNIVVNISSGKGVRLLDIIEYMNEIAGYKIEIVQDKNLIRKNDIKKLIGDNTLLTSLVGKINDKPLKELLKEMYYAWDI